MGREDTIQPITASQPRLSPGFAAGLWWPSLVWFFHLWAWLCAAPPRGEGFRLPYVPGVIKRQEDTWGQEFKAFRCCPWCLERCVMANVVCQLDWVTRYPYIWWDIVLNLCGYFSMRSTSELVDWIKAQYLLKCGWASSNLFMTWQNQNLRKEFMLSVFKLGHQSSPDFGTWTWAGT